MEANPQKVIDTVTEQINDADSVPLDELVENTTREYTNHWNIESCFDVIDDADRVSARNIGETPRDTELSHTSGDTTLERETRHWAAVAITEEVLDGVDGETVRDTVEM